MTQYRQPIQVCLFTNTTPSARLNEAPVGQTSTHGADSQCWHIMGSDDIRPERLSFKSILRIHCASVLSLPVPVRPCSSLHPRTQASQSVAHLELSIRRPQRCVSLTAPEDEVADCARRLTTDNEDRVATAPSAPIL